MPIYLTLQLAGGAARHVTVAPGGLLPRLFTLTTEVAVILCHLNPEVAPSFPLRNAMLCVARTFLSRSSGASDKPLHYFCGCKGSDFFENQNKKMTERVIFEDSLVIIYFND